MIKKHVILSYLIVFILQIPFSKFVYTSKGWIQDRQRRVELDRLTKISITLADKYVSRLEPGRRLCVSLTFFLSSLRIDGPFRLEVGKIGVHRARGRAEDFRYENYYLPYPRFNQT